MLLLQLMGPEYFRFERDWVDDLQLWRLFTAHWIHVGWMHLLMNALGLIVCVSIASPNWSIQRWLLQCLSMALGISILFTLQNPELHWYVGFSGVLFGLYFLAAVDLYARDRLIALLMGGAIVGKVVLEQYTGFEVTSSELIGAPVIVDAHFYGLMLAIAIALAWRTYTMNHRPTKVAGRVDDARISKAKSDIRVLESSLELYKLDNFNYPSTEQGLQALVSKPSGDNAKNWRDGGYIKKLNKDPWGNDYQYQIPGSNGEFDVYSMGADAAVGGSDDAADIGNWNLDS